MILCVDSRWLMKSPDVQKKINLEDILNHTKYFNSVEEALKCEEAVHVPLDFMVTVRSAYTNLVLEKDCEDTSDKRYYINLTHVDLLPHKGYDLVMYMTSVGVMHSVNPTSMAFNEVMMKSQFCPIGLYNPDPDIMNPIVYSQVVLHDDAVEQYDSYLREGFRFVHIDNMKREGNLSAILDTIIRVEEKQDEPTENNDQ